MERAVPGHDAVIVTASSGSLAGSKENPTFFSQGTKLVIRAIKASGVRDRLSEVRAGSGSQEEVRSPGFCRPHRLNSDTHDHNRIATQCFCTSCYLGDMEFQWPQWRFVSFSPMVYCFLLCDNLVTTLGRYGANSGVAPTMVSGYNVQ